MIEIVMSVCALISPFNCREHHMSFEGEQVSLQECLLYGQFEMAKWSNENPNWRIARWRCGIAGQIAKI
jgi:hypothetical protein